MHTVPSISEREVAQQFYRQLSSFEDSINFYHSVPAIVAPCTTGVVADCSLPGIAIGLLKTGFIKAGLGVMCLYAAINISAEAHNVSCVPFCLTNMLLEDRRTSMANAAIPSNWQLDANVNALLQSWRDDLGAQSNGGHINIQQWSTDNAQRSSNDIVAVKTMIANVYKRKYNQSIEEKIKTNEGTPLLSQNSTAQME